MTLEGLVLTGWIIKIEDKYFSGVDQDTGGTLFVDDPSLAEIIVAEEKPLHYASHCRDDYVWEFAWEFTDDAFAPKVTVFKCSITVLEEEELK